MGNKKRRQDDDDDELGNSASYSDTALKEVTTSKSTTSKSKTQPKAKTAKKPKFEVSGDEASTFHEEGKQSAVQVLMNAEGERYVDLGKKKRAAVRSFKGQVFVDIREFYGTGGDEKPGKKGISLQKEQWEALKCSISAIDSLFAQEGKK